MKPPHAILIGLSLIAGAIFLKDMAIKPAHACGPLSEALARTAKKSCLNEAGARNRGVYSDISARFACLCIGQAGLPLGLRPWRKQKRRRFNARLK